jgi:DNA-binding Xre family transcriptional regulator
VLKVINKILTMEYIEKIKFICKKKGITLKNLAENIGMTEGGFHLSVKNNTLKVDHLLKICSILEIDISDLFNKEFRHLANEPAAVYMNSNDLLKKILQNIESIENQLKKSENGKV